METKELSAAELMERMRRTGVTQRDIAREARLKAPDLSAILHGRRAFGPVRHARIVAAIVKLGLDKEPAEAEPTVVFRLTRF